LYYAKIDAVFNALRDDLKDEFINHIQRNWTPLQIERWNDYRDQIRAYNSVWTVELTTGGYNEEQQKLISIWYSDPQSTRGREIQESAMFDENTKLINRFKTRSGQIKENMRGINPELDAVLRFWGKVTTSKSKEADILYQEKVARFRFKATE